MAFPDDYRRVQFAGGIKTDVDVHQGLPGQVLVDKTDWNLRLLDGVTEGGYKVQMEKDLPNSLQAAGVEGEALHIALGTDAGVGNPDSKARIWKASKLKAFFNKFISITMNGDNSDYTVALLDSALRSSIRTTGTLISDLNAATTSGWYRFIQSGTVNMPPDMPNTGTNQAYMLVMTQAVNSLVQMIVARDGSAKIWIRGRADGDWGDWALATGVTGADLAAKLTKAGDSMLGKLTLAASVVGRASLNLLSGTAPTVPVDGDIWRNDTAGGIMLHKAGSTVKILDSQAAFRSSVAIIGDQKAQGTVTGAAVTSAWTPHDLNTEFYDPDGLVTIASNQFTLATGFDYLVYAQYFMQTYNGALNLMRIYNVTDGVQVSPVLGGVGSVNGNASGSYFIQQCEGILQGGKTYRFEYYSTMSLQKSGPRNAALNLGPEVYLYSRIERLRHVIA